MNTDISLNQGKKFNKYQNKIKQSVDMQHLFTSNPNSSKKVKNHKSVETFENIFKKTARNLKIVEKKNDSEAEEREQLAKQFDILSSEYESLAKEASASTKDILARNSNINPHRGKNIILNGSGALGYVSDLGTYKWWNNWNDVNASQGKNGCPVVTYDENGSPDISSDYVNVKNSYVYNSPGAVIDTKPSLVVGTPMVSGQSCGNEGKNIYVNQRIYKPTATYIGCYQDFPSSQPDGSQSEDQRAMIWNPDVIGTTTLDACKQFASDNDFAYFGMQNAQPDGTAACLVSNDYAATTKYGPPPVYISIPVWSYYTSPGNYLIMENSRLIIRNSAGNDVVRFPDGEDQACVNGGALNMIDGFSATYGGNCSANNVKNNNVGPIVQGYYNLYSLNNKFGDSPFLLAQAISNDMFGDPAQGCPKGFDTVYKCGNTTMSGHMDYAENQVYYYDCRGVQATCSFIFFVQDDGNLCIWKNGVDGIWGTGPIANFGVQNPGWSGGGKYGNNILSNGQRLNPGEWIGSSNGCYKLIMQSDGNLVLYAAQLGAQCYENDKGEMVAPNLMNAVYKIDNLGDDAAVGKVAYIDGNTNLHEYPSDMLGKSTNYSMLQNTDSWYNDIYNYPDATVDSCKTSCNNNDACGGFAFDNRDQMCWIKNTEMYPKGDKQYAPGMDLYMREPSVCKTTKYTKYDNTKSGGNDIGEIDNVTVDQCEAACDNDTNCSGFVYHRDNNQCNPKNSNMPTSERQTLDTADLYLRNTDNSDKGKYIKFAGKDSLGNDLGSVINDSTVDQCQALCDNTDGCGGFAFDNKNNCYIKNGKMPASEKQSNDNMDLYVRNTNQCVNIDAVVDSIQYDAYIKSNDMSEGINFDLVIPDIRIQNRLSELEQQLADLANQISDNLNTVYDETTNLNSVTTDKEVTLSNDLKSYYNIKQQIDSLLSQDPNYKNQGSTNTKNKNTTNKRSSKNNNISTNNNNMQTVETMLNMNDLDAMVSDSDLIVIQQNSQYILWTLLALGILVITVNTLKK